jgi:HD-like signal output (HDOD) protein/ActR/RegA family two-component response regulator
VNEILLVDDEPDVLAGLRNVLRRHRSRWNMRFALGGEAALRELEARPADVVVTDMRMPGMDGLALLESIRQRHPRAARIVLSGQAELSAVVRASSAAHQYLLKPCAPEALSSVVERALDIQALLTNERLREVVGGLGTLPSAPALYHALTAAMGDPDVEVKKLAVLVKQDVGLSSRVLRLVNSAYCGLARRVSSIDAAIVALGLNTLRHLALTVEVFRGFGGDGGPAFDELEHHALLTARIARRLAPNPAADMAFAAGLLHDAGKLVLMSRTPDLYERVVEESRLRGTTASVVEKELVGADHAEIGAYLLGLWDLPHAIIEPVAHHHALERMGAGGSDTARLVAIADALACETSGLQPANAWWETLGSKVDVERWREAARAEAAAKQ